MHSDELPAVFDSLVERWGADEAQRRGVAWAARTALRVLPRAWSRSIGGNNSDIAALAYGRASLLALYAAHAGVDRARGVLRQHTAALAQHEERDEAEARQYAEASGGGDVSARDLEAAQSVYAAFATATAGASEWIVQTLRARESAEASLEWDGDPILSEEMGLVIMEDLKALQDHQSALERPLWFPDDSGPLAWISAVERLEASPLDWSFWLRWYEKLLKGEPQDWPLLAEITMIPPEDWDQGPAHVNAIIAELQLKQAVAKTPNAEVISVNESTLKLRVDPLSEMPRDHLDEAVEKLRDVANLFKPSADWSNQHRALEPERELIEQATERYPERPRMLHSSCIRVIRRMDVKIKNGDCPSQEQDADIADFYGTVLSVSLDLYERDPLVREAVDHAAGARLHNLKQDEADAIVRAADEVAERSEDELATELPEQARAAVDPNTPSVERKEALYVIKSRLLRSYLILVWRGAKGALEEIEKVSGTVAGICKHAATIAKAGAVITSPMWLKPAIDIIMRMLN